MAAAVTLQSNALLTYDEVKDALGKVAQTNQPQVNAAINRVSDAFERYTNRWLRQRKVWNSLHRRTDEIAVKAFPIQRILGVYTGFDLVTATGTADSGSTTTLVDSTLTQADDYWNGATLDIQTTTDNWERVIVNDFVASTDTLSWESAQATSVTASGKDFALTLYNKSAYYALQITDYREINHEAGIISLPGAYNLLVVDYVGGFSQSGGAYPLPDDLKQAAIWQVLDWLNASAHGQASAINLGTTNVSYRDRSGAALTLIPDVKLILDRYRRIVLG